MWRTYTDPDAADRKFIDIEYYAWQGKFNDTSPVPFTGSQSSKTRLKPKTRKGVHCQQIQFAKELDEAPLVIGSADYEVPQEGNPHTPIASWLGAISTKSFEVCIRLDAREVEVPAKIHFTWLAIEHRNPELWYPNKMPYLAAGHEAAGVWQHDDNSAEEEMYISCKEVKFERTYRQLPKVIVTANYQKDGEFSIMRRKSTPVISYVTQVVDTGFEVCSRVWGDKPGDKDLHWDYVAFSADGGTVTTADVLLSVSESV